MMMALLLQKMWHHLQHDCSTLDQALPSEQLPGCFQLASLPACAVVKSRICYQEDNARFYICRSCHLKVVNLVGHPGSLRRQDHSGAYSPFNTRCNIFKFTKTHLTLPVATSTHICNIETFSHSSSVGDLHLRVYITRCCFEHSNS